MTKHIKDPINPDDLVVSHAEILKNCAALKDNLDELGRQVAILKSPTYIVVGGNPFRGYTNTLTFTGLKSLGEFKDKEIADGCVNLHYEDCGGLIAIFEVNK